MPQAHLPLTPQQTDLMHWTASLGAITAEALALRMGVTPASARGHLSAAVRRGLLARRRLLVDAPTLYTITRPGLRACGGYGIGPCRLSPGNAHHAIVCAEVAAALERCYPDHRLIGERELRRDERELMRPLASARLAAERLHRPDLVLWPEDPRALPVAVEVELTIKAPRRLAGICRAWAASSTVSGVLYLAPDQVQRALERAIEKARARERVVVLPLEALPSFTAA
ncbi:MAG: hypothetical protein WB998_06010 [Solirubrobacteraceae bacterium]